MKKKLTENITAPDFELQDTQERIIKLSDFRAKQHVVLVLNRGFVCPFCRRHLGQLRKDYQQFTTRGAEILALGPDGTNAFRHFWDDNQMPFIGLSDVKSKVADLYYQEVNLLKLGRMPALFVIDRKGLVRYLHYGEAMQDTAKNAEVLAILDQLNTEQ